METKSVSLAKPKRNAKLTKAIMDLANKVHQCNEVLMQTTAQRKAYQEAIRILEANNK